MKFLRKSWPVWAVWAGTLLFLTGLAINPFWTFFVIYAGNMVLLLVMSIYAAIDMAKED